MFFDRRFNIRYQFPNGGKSDSFSVPICDQSGDLKVLLLLLFAVVVFARFRKSYQGTLDPKRKLGVTKHFNLKRNKIHTLFCILKLFRLIIADYL